MGFLRVCIILDKAHQNFSVGETTLQNTLKSLLEVANIFSHNTWLICTGNFEGKPISQNFMWTPAWGSLQLVLAAHPAEQQILKLVGIGV